MSRHRIFGTLATAASVRVDPQSMRYGVHVELVPTHTHAEPIVARVDYSGGAKGHSDAYLAAKRLKRGARVYVHCLAIGIGHTASQEAAIRCVGVDLIELLDRPADYTDPSATTSRHDHQTTTTTTTTTP